MRDLVGDRLPKFTVADMKMVKGSLDFVGVNYYTARFAEEATASGCDIDLSYTTDSHANLTTERNGIPIGEQTAASWLYVYPEGIRDLALYVRREYNNLPIIITENGMADPNNRTIPLDDALDDSSRIKFHFMHLSYLLEAIKFVLLSRF
uniref:Beta-glucosidase 17-like n=1 Tax=Rhizophora mucronata TaxID=61149 RepID=A0A2P2LKK4_RHIMU